MLEPEMQQEAPNPSVSFDIERNPDDMQFMTDAMMYAPMLKGMDEEQRKEKWPDIANRLGEVSPKGKAMLDPTLPPTDDDLDALLEKMPDKGQFKQVAATRKDYLEDQVNRQIEGKKPISQNDYNKQEAEKEEAVKKAKGSKASMVASYEVPSDLDTANMSDEELIANAVYSSQQNLGKKIGLLDEDETDPKFKGAPPGFMWKDPNNRDKGLINLKKMNEGASQYAAGQMTMMKVSKQQLPTIKTLLFTDDGKVNWDNVAKSNLPIVGGAMPWASEAKRLANAYEQAIQAVTRVETGAAMPAAEVTNTRRRYQCNVWDSEDACIQKYLSLKMFVNGYVDITFKKGNEGKFDTAKADASDAQLQLHVQNYKKDWIQRAMKANPQASPSELHQLFNKKILNDSEFLKKMGTQLKGQ